MRVYYVPKYIMQSLQSEKLFVIQIILQVELNPNSMKYRHKYLLFGKLLREPWK